MSQDETAAKTDEVVAQETTNTAPAPVENKTPDVADTFDEVWDKEAPAEEVADAETVAKDEAAAPKEEQPSEAEADEPTAEEQPQGKADERKQQLEGEIQTYKEKLGISPNSEIRDMVAARNALKQAAEQANAEVYQVQTPDELVAEGMDETRALVESMKQEQALEKYNSRVADAQLTLESESNKVLADFPIFNPDSESYRPEVAAQAAELLNANLVTDQNTGQVIGSNISPYKLYATIASAAQASEVTGQIAGQKATEKMLANADSLGNAAPPKTKADPILEIWAD